MSDYNWCHGPNCHTNHTQSRVRGSGDNKVLRTIKIKQGRYNGYQNGIWDYFSWQMPQKRFGFAMVSKGFAIIFLPGHFVRPQKCLFS